MTTRAPLAVAIAALLAAAPARALDRYVVVKEVAGLGDAKDRAFFAKVSARVRAAAIEELRGRYQVMMPDNVEEILRRSGKKGQEILARCSEASCAAQFGQILGADLVVAGTFAELEGTLDLTVEVYDVGTANVLGSDSVRAKGKLELVDQVFELTRALLRRAVPPQPSSPARPAPAVGAFEDPLAAFAAAPVEVAVAFESAPAGAVVLLDGQLLCTETPCRRRVAAGEHVAVFQKERHAPATQSFIAAKGATVQGTLTPRYGWLSVETVPPGIAVTVDGADAGKSPVAWSERDAGTVEVAIADPCFAHAGERVRVGGGERRAVKLVAKPRLAGLRVEAEDAKGNALDAPVTVDGAPAGVAGEVLRVPVCAKRVSVALGSETFASDLKLEEGKVVTVTARAKPPRSPAPAAPAAGAAAGAKATPEAAPAVAAAAVEAASASSREAVLLPGGTFKLGARTGPRRDLVQYPSVGDLEVDRTEVTVAAYAECARAGACTPAGSTVHWDGISDRDREKWSPQCNRDRPDRADHPVNCVDLTQASAYCAWKGKRLPTEAEFEWAARNGRAANAYAWGDEAPADQLCWNGEGSSAGKLQRSGTCPVGSYPRGGTKTGIVDLAGNVWEWTSSIEYPEGGWANLANKLRVVRGGGWLEATAARVSASVRQFDGETFRGVDLGFRCVKDR
jgi:formylglycine-generating enzyme required for sulfatase activity